MSATPLKVLALQVGWMCSLPLQPYPVSVTLDPRVGAT